MSDFLLVLASIAAGAVSAVTGFGIGSLLTPVFALQADTAMAVAAVSVPHVAGTAFRLWLLQARSIDRRVFWNFGLTSAAGGLIGALLQGWAGSRVLTGVFGVLLFFAALSEVTGLARRMRFTGAAAWIAGALSGLLGGLVGNQGGIRSAALLGFGLSKQALVGTATAVALLVDGARLPVYVAVHGRDMLALWPWVAGATVCVLAGTLIGSRLLRRIPERAFRIVLAVVLAVLGTAMLVKAV